MIVRLVGDSKLAIGVNVHQTGNLPRMYPISFPMIFDLDKQKKIDGGVGISEGHMQYNLLYNFKGSLNSFTVCWFSASSRRIHTIMKMSLPVVVIMLKEN